MMVVLAVELSAMPTTPAGTENEPEVDALY